MVSPEDVIGAVAIVLLVVIACSSPTFEYVDEPADAAGDATAGSGGVSGVGAQGGEAGNIGGAGGSAAGAGGGSGGTSTGCPSGDVCTPSAPSGWQGPWWVYRAPVGGTPPSCPGASTAALTAHIGLAPGSASCGCTCTGSANCAESLNVTFSEASCGGATCDTKSLTAGQCVQLGQGCSAFASVGAAPTPGPCTPVPKPSIPTAGWQELALACAAPTSEPCASGVCVGAPVTPFERLCIGKPGDEPCVAGYSDKVLAYQSFSDTRACETCNCTPQGCGTVTIYPNGCGSSTSQKVLPGTCGPGYAVGGTVSSVFARYSKAGGGCVPNKPAVTGSVVGTGPVTICCRT